MGTQRGKLYQTMWFWAYSQTTPTEVARPARWGCSTGSESYHIIHTVTSYIYTMHMCHGQKLDFYFPLPFGLNLATLQLCAWCMFLSYTNSWGAPIVGPGLLLTFTIFSHHSFKCTDLTTRVRGCVIMDLWVHARVESKVGLHARIEGWSSIHVLVFIFTFSVYIYIYVYIYMYIYMYVCMYTHICTSSHDMIFGFPLCDGWSCHIQFLTMAGGYIHPKMAALMEKWWS